MNRKKSSPLSRGQSSPTSSQSSRNNQNHNQCSQWSLINQCLKNQSKMILQRNNHLKKWNRGPSLWIHHQSPITITLKYTLRFLQSSNPTSIHLHSWVIRWPVCPWHTSYRAQSSSTRKIRRVVEMPSTYMSRLSSDRTIVSFSRTNNRLLVEDARVSEP